jgi:hypothetical protein
MKPDFRCKNNASAPRVIERTAVSPGDAKGELGSRDANDDCQK